MGKDLTIGGLTPLTTIDFPGRLAAVVYCQGCPWRCRYCHNAELVEDRSQSTLPWSDVIVFLQRRRGLLDGVVFSGGEPTAQGALPNALREVAALGFAIGLHTNGAYPARLERILPDLAWVGLDIKALPEHYPAITGVADSGEPAWQSLALLQRSDVAFDVRVTVHDRLLPETQLAALTTRLKQQGIERPSIQVCRTDEMLDPSLGHNSYRAA
jgi:pyruvate formate lyase activating enzyme